MLYVYAVFHGLTMGGWPTIANLAWASYFGRQHQGAIRGFVTPIGNMIGAASPVLGGYVWDRYGTYDLAFVVFGTAWIMAGTILMLWAVPPRPPVKAVLAPKSSSWPPALPRRWWNPVRAVI